MRIILGCECSGIIRDAFIARGHDAVSCDLLPTERPGPHIQGDLLEVINDGWDMGIFHPPCTYLGVVANAWFTDEWLKKEPWRVEARQQAIDFAVKLWNAPIPKICMENPKGILSKYIGKPQIIQPYYFGDPYQKETHLWLKGLPKLFHSPAGDLFSDPTHSDPGEFYYYKNKKTGKLRRQPMWFFKARHAKEGHGRARSRTFPGIAAAMAQQWG